MDAYVKLYVAYELDFGDRVKKKSYSQDYKYEVTSAFWRTSRRIFQIWKKYDKNIYLDF